MRWLQDCFWEGDWRGETCNRNFFDGFELTFWSCGGLSFFSFKWFLSIVIWLLSSILCGCSTHFCILATRNLCTRVAPLYQHHPVPLKVLLLLSLAGISLFDGSVSFCYCCFWWVQLSSYFMWTSNLIQHWGFSNVWAHEPYTVGFGFMNVHMNKSSLLPSLQYVMIIVGMRFYYRIRILYEEKEWK